MGNEIKKKFNYPIQLHSLKKSVRKSKRFITSIGDRSPTSLPQGTRRKAFQLTQRVPCDEILILRYCPGDSMENVIRIRV